MALRAPLPRVAARIGVGLLLIFGIIAVALTAFSTATGEFLLTHYSTAQGFVAAHRILAMMAFMGLYIAIIALCVPVNAMMALLAGVLFGGLTGGLIAVLSATIGGVIFFSALRVGFAQAAARRAPARIVSLMEGFKRDGFFYLLFLRLTPVFPFFMVNLAAGLCGIRLITFVTATLIGIAPVTFSYAFTAAGLDQAVAAQAGSFLACKAAAQAVCPGVSLTALAGPDFLLPLSLIGVLTVLPVLIRRGLLRRA